MRYFVAIGRFFKKPWMRIPLLILSLILFGVVVWVGGPLLGFGEARPFASVWVRASIIIGVLLIFAIVWFIRWRRARKGAEELEEALIPQEATGDGAVLGERMSEALNTLKASGGKSYLYDLPWYVIIGPPGAGKTTALLNAGIKFPLAEKSGAAMEGFGGTRYCDWWFAEEAVMIDTAGRLQNRADLMEELSKIVRVIRKKDPDAPHNTLLVLDATTGQNALNQVKVFQELSDVSGLVMTKLDGTAKGGVLVALADKFGLPIHAIGVGEQIDDLAPFDPEEFANALTGAGD